MGIRVFYNNSIIPLGFMLLALSAPLKVQVHVLSLFFQKCSGWSHDAWRSTLNLLQVWAVPNDADGGADLMPSVPRSALFPYEWRLSWWSALKWTAPWHSALIECPQSSGLTKDIWNDKTTFTQSWPFSRIGWHCTIHIWVLWSARAGALTMKERKHYMMGM